MYSQEILMIWRIMYYKTVESRNSHDMENHVLQDCRV
jgi:hypothetical protein